MPSPCAAAILVGARVEAKFDDDDTSHYPGVVTAVQTGTFAIAFDDGNTDHCVPFADLRLLKMDTNSSVVGSSVSIFNNRKSVNGTQSSVSPSSNAIANVRGGRGLAFQVRGNISHAVDALFSVRRRWSCLFVLQNLPRQLPAL